MAADFANLRRMDAILWAIVAAVAATVLAAVAVGDFQPVWVSFAVPAAVSGALAIGARYYESRRRDPRFASALAGTAQIIAFAAVGAPLSYVAASVGLPLQDSLFDAADRALGFGWHAALDWMNGVPAIHPAFSFAYQSFTVQASVAILCLSLSGRAERLRVFILAFMAATLVSIAISALLPAQGVWGYLGLGPADHAAIHPVTRELHLPVFHGLRDGSYRLLFGFGSAGIITFPSLHAAVALIFIFALWPIPLLRWAALAVNLLMIAATPVDGGHYLIDVIAGLLIAWACWVAASAAADRTFRGARHAPAGGAAQKSWLAPGE